MAVTTLPLLLLLLLLAFCSLPPPALSRHHLHSHHRHSHRHPLATTTATLDVSASLSLASSALYPLAHTPTSIPSSTPTSSLLSLSLNPRRDRHPHPHHPSSYLDLTLSRLRRDSARVLALTTRAQLASSNTPTSDLTPLDSSTLLEPESSSSMEGPVISGTRQGSGEYFSRIGLGRPSRELYMVLDTGSDVTWVQCEPCADCYDQTDPVYDPSASSTFRPLPCASERCHQLDISACRNGSCLYQVSYGDGSYTVGDFATEAVSLGNDEGVPGVAFGCGHDNEGLFIGAAGLLGLGRGTLSFPSQLQASSFSYCLVDRDSSASSTLEFGRNGSDVSDLAATAAATSRDVIIAPLLRNRKLDTFYYVELTGLSVGGHVLEIPASAFAMDESGYGGVIVDSGTAITRLQPRAYEALRDAFRAGTADLPPAPPVALFDTCYDLASRTTVEVPTVAMRFPAGRQLKLPAKNYLIPVDGAGTFCLAFAPTASERALSIIGNVQQQGTRVSFDLKKNRVGFASNRC